MTQNTYTLFWLNGKSQIVTGNSAHEAMNNAGIGAGALRTLDFYAIGDARNVYNWDAKEQKWYKPMLDI